MKPQGKPLKPPAGRWRDGAVLALFFASGAAGLVYEQLWTRQITLTMGSAIFATTTVVCAFMAGLGAGAWAGGRVAPRLGRPGFTYGALEVFIGLYAIALPFLLNAATPLYRLLYRAAETRTAQLTLGQFAIAFALLAAPTAAMGASLPLVIRQLRRLNERGGVLAGRAYAVNTAGAFAGALAGGFALLPAWGNAGTLWAAAGASLAVGAAAMAVFRRETVGRASADGQATSRPAKTGAKPRMESRLQAESSAAFSVQMPGIPPEGGTPYANAASTEREFADKDEPGRAERRIVFLGYGLSGLAAMALEIAWTRAGVVALDTSSYAFSIILATFILGLALGGFAGARLARRVERPLRSLGVIHVAIAAAVLLGCPWFDSLPWAVRKIYTSIAPHSFALQSAGRFLLFGGIALVPTLLMGMAYPLTVRVLRSDARRGESQAGAAAYGFNSLCAVAGAFLAGFALIPGPLHTQGTIVAAATTAGLIGIAYLWLAGAREWRVRLAAEATGVALLMAVCASVIGFGAWDPSKMLRGSHTAPAQFGIDKVLYYREGVDATVAVTYLAPQQLIARINGKPDASNGLSDAFSRLMLGHYAAFLAPKAERALLIGLGSGMTLSGLTSHQQFQRIDCVELVQGMIEAAEQFKSYTDNAIDDPRVHLIRGDGRTHLALGDETYDLIVSEPTNPWVAGAAALFTREFYEACRARLNPDGVAAFWVPGFAISFGDFRALAATILHVFPYAAIFEGHFNDYLFLCSDQPLSLDLGEWMTGCQSKPIARTLSRIGYLDHPAAPLAGYMGDGGALRAQAGTRMVTDANSTLEFGSARGVIAHEEDEALRFVLSAEADPFQSFIRVPKELRETAGVLRQKVALYRDARRARLQFLTACRRQDAAAALAAAQRIRDLTPEDPRAFEALNDSLTTLAADAARRGDRSTAELLRQAVDQLTPPLALLSRTETSPKLLARGIQALEMKQYDAAEKMFRDALERESNYVPARIQLARLALARGRAQEALDWLQPYQDNEALAGNVRIIFAAALAELGKTNEAIGELGKALDHGFRDTALLAKSSYFEPLRRAPEFWEALRKRGIDLQKAAAPSSAAAARQPAALLERIAE
ncbi:MAG: fused MFS/spermidine synthase [Candidatus Sumerlaeota bacterium]|nr:fused MFS/spermidine synthase [Candidatus Sumerlaeota bacterium]